jgi:class 3 adenylate cyclase
MTRFENIRTPTGLDLLVCFTHLAGFNKRFVLPNDDSLVFATMQAYYAWAGALIQKAGGTVIKCMGDALLIAFPADAATTAVKTLQDLKQSGDLWLKQRQIPCHHLVKIHLGPVVAGPIGVPGAEHLDIFGKTVNLCVTMESDGWAMSPQVFRALDGETRTKFKKHTPPVTYIRVEDSHK